MKKRNEILITILVETIVIIGLAFTYNYVFSNDKIDLSNDTPDTYKKDNSVKDVNSGTLVCTKSETDEDNMTIEDTIKIKYKNNIVKNIESSTIIQTLPEYIDMSISLNQTLVNQFSEVKGLNYKVSKKDNSHIETIVSIDYNKVDIDKLKELLSTEENNDNFINSIKNKNLTLDEYKLQNLDGYSCK